MVFAPTELETTEGSEQKVPFCMDPDTEMMPAGTKTVVKWWVSFKGRADRIGW